MKKLTRNILWMEKFPSTFISFYSVNTYEKTVNSGNATLIYARA